MEELSLLDHIELLPEEMQTKLLSFLEYNEVLRLRRVCNRFRCLAEVHLTRRASRSPLEINLNSDATNSLSKFKALRFCDDFFLPEVLFSNDDVENNADAWNNFLQNPDLDWFMETYAPHVKHLHLSSLQLPISSVKLLTFLEAFVNLEEFRCDTLILMNPDIWEIYSNDEPLISPVFIPKPLRSIKRLLVETVQCCVPVKDPTLKELARFWRLVDKINQTTLLEESWIPDFIAENYFDYNAVPTQLESVTEVIKSGIRRNKPMKTLRLTHLSAYSEHDPEMFRTFFQLCAAADIYFEDCQTSYFQESLGDQFTKYVKSMSSAIPKEIQLQNYPNLEKAHLWFCNLENSVPANDNLRCPNLRGFSLEFFRDDVTDEYAYEQEFFDLMLHNTKHPNLTSLSIEFEDAPSLIRPGPFTSSCTNLRYLCLKNCSANWEVYAELWKGLKCLEYLKLSGCTGLKDESFTGHIPEEPVFLQLKNLKFVELTDLAQMPGVTDTTLEDSIRYMKLRYFRLASGPCQMTEYDYQLSPHTSRFANNQYPLDGPEINTISLRGLRSLKTGAFGESIEKFDIRGLRLADTTREDLKGIGKELRSYNF